MIDRDIVQRHSPSETVGFSVRYSWQEAHDESARRSQSLLYRWNTRLSGGHFLAAKEGAMFSALLKMLAELEVKLYYFNPAENLAWAGAAGKRVKLVWKNGRWEAIHVMPF